MWQLSGARIIELGLESLSRSASEIYEGWQRTRRIRMPSQPMKALVAGKPCKVTGVVEATTLETAPFTQTSCAYYSVRLEQRKIREDRGFEEIAWEQQLHVVSTSPFWLIGDDGTKVLVDTVGAVSDLPTNLVSEHARVNDENPVLSAFLRSQGVLTTMYMGISGDYRFFESTLRPGARVSALGTVRAERVATNTGYRGASATAACIGGEPLRPLRVVPVAT